MRRYLTAAWYAIVLFSILGFCTDSVHAQKEANPAPVFSLEISKFRDQTEEAPPLFKEIIRQGFLLTVREEFGMQTRDQALGEPLLNTNRFRLRIVKNQNETRVDLYKIPQKKAPELVWRYSSIISGDTYRKNDLTILVDEVDTFIRNGFVFALELAGLKRNPRKLPLRYRVHSTKPRVFDMPDFNPLSLFGSIKKTHKDMNEFGPNCSGYARLATAYADLGAMTRMSWGRLSPAFHARSLVYSKYAGRLFPEDEEAGFSMVYAQALAGLFQQARKTAAGFGSDMSQLPEFVKMALAYATYDINCLGAFENKSRSQFLRYFAANGLVFNSLRRQWGKSSMQSAPYVFRTHISFSKSGGVSQARYACGLMDVAWCDFLKKIVKGTQITVQPDFTDSENPTTANLAQHVLRVSRALSEKEKAFSAEFSYNVLAYMLENLYFMSMDAQLDYYAYKWSVPVEKHIKALAPFIENHPWGPYLLRYADNIILDTVAVKEKVVSALSFPDSPYCHVNDFDTFWSWRYAIEKKLSDTSELNKWIHKEKAIFSNRIDDTVDDLLDCARKAEYWYDVSMFEKMRDMDPENPHIPLLVIEKTNSWESNYTKISFNWPHIMPIPLCAPIII